MQSITPGRIVTLTLDVDENVVVDPGLSIVRAGADIAKRAVSGTANPAEFLNLYFVSSGAWILKPLQYDIENVQETTTALAAVIRKSAWSFIQVLGPSGNQDAFVELQNWKQGDLAGELYSMDVPTSGDYFMKLQIPATGSSDPADPALSGANSTFDSAGPPALPYEYNDVPMDRVAVSTASYGNNRGFFLRFKADIHANTYPRYLFTFFFGQYAVVFSGSGTARLWEFCKPEGSDTPRWAPQRREFRYASAGAAPASAHSIGIYPHRSPDGTNYIAFSDVANNKAPQNNTSAVGGPNSAVVFETIYKMDRTVRGTDQDASPGYVTSANNLRIDLRRGLRLSLQVSTLVYEETGTLIDDDGLVGSGVWTDNTNSVVATQQAVVDGTYTITGTVEDAETDTAFTPGTSIFPRAKFAFAGDGAGTPHLWGYSLQQDPITATASPGSFSMHSDGTVDAVHSLSIEACAGDPTTEAATVNTFDKLGTHSRLIKRGELSALLQTTYTPPGGSEKTVTLIRGTCVKPRATKKSSLEYDNWYTHSLSVVGMWRRLSERVQGGTPRTFAMDPSSASQTWKITDALVFILKAAGFPSGQIGIPDLGYRFWPGYTQKIDDVVVNPTSGLGEFAISTVHDYLGAYLIFEPNAGSAGKWMLLWGTQPNEDGSFTPVYNFVSAPQSGWPNDPYHPASFDDNTTFIQGDGVNFTPNPPDFNAIYVTTGFPTTDKNDRMQQVSMAFNPLSYAVPGMSTSPDPNHPDYIGRWRGGVIIKPELEGSGPDDTKFAVEWACRRAYNFYCHGQRIATFTAPLAMIHDSAIATGSASGGYRPLRFQDPISIDGDPTWLIKSMRPIMGNGGIQMCEYECIQPFPGQFFFGFDGKEQRRRSSRLRNLRHAGITHSGGFGSVIAAPHRVHSHLELPVVRGGFRSIQNTDGSFISMTGWNTIDGSDG